MAARQLSVFYGEKQALFDVDLDVPERSVTALIGPSGCGKSTFLRCLNRMNDTIEDCVVTGRVTIDNQDIYDRGIDVVELRARIGMVFQKPNPFPKSIYDNVSGGQQQRLCIARAIAVSPEVILMDEPCSALDPIATAHIEELIDELRANYTIVIVTHNMQQAARVSQMTAFFHLGELVECAATEEIFTSPQDERTQGYITGRYG